jgi:hypothetical protein
MLSDAEYSELSGEAAKLGTTPEVLAHARLARALPVPRVERAREIEEALLRRGVIQDLPTQEPDTPEEEAEAERLADLLGGGTSAAELVIEGQGPF